MHVVDVDVVGVEALEACIALLDEMVARRADVILALAHAEGGLGREQHLVAAAFDRLTEDLFSQAMRIYICHVKKVDACVHAYRNEASSFVDVGLAPCLEECIAAAEGSDAEGEHRDFEP